MESDGHADSQETRTTERVAPPAEQAEDEITELRRRLQEAGGTHARGETARDQGQLAHAVSQNEKLTYTLQQAKEHIAPCEEVTS